MEDRASNYTAHCLEILDCDESSPIAHEHSLKEVVSSFLYCKIYIGCVGKDIRNKNLHKQSPSWLKDVGIIINNFYENFLATHQPDIFAFSDMQMPSRIIPKIWNSGQLTHTYNFAFLIWWRNSPNKSPLPSYSTLIKEKILHKILSITKTSQLPLQLMKIHTIRTCNQPKDIINTKDKRRLSVLRILANSFFSHTK